MTQDNRDARARLLSIATAVPPHRRYRSPH